MININNIKTAPQSLKYLNDAVLGRDPEAGALSRVYESNTPIQDRVTAVENSAALVDVQALKDKVEELSELTEVFANLAYPMPNLVVNGDLKIDANSDKIPDGFSLLDANANSLVNGVFTFTATAQNARFNYILSPNLIDTYYAFAFLKVSGPSIYLYSLQNNAGGIIYHSGSGNYELLSIVNTSNGNNNNLQIRDSRASGFTPISVDYTGTFNVSTMKLKGVKNDDGVPFTLLTNGQIKTQLDLWVQTRFPLDVLLMMRS